jgi:hypothetical protein
VEELETLLVKAQSGDLEAYGEIVQRFQDMAVAYARAILGDFHLAEDVAQEAFPSFIYKPDNPQEPVIHIVIEVKTEGYEDLTLSLCYFLSTLEPALPDLK